MMNSLKKYFTFLLTMVLCMGLTACGDVGDVVSSVVSDVITGDIAGADWRTTGVARDGGTITRDGEDTYVLVCIHKADATFYYDTENQMLFDSVDYPIILEGDPWEMFQGIDFADLNGDGNSDVTMRFSDGGSEIVLVWYWKGEEGYVYQPEESSIGGRKTTEEIYHELLERFYALVSDPGSFDTAKAGETGVLESAQDLGEDALNGIGYLIEDLSGDGVPELAVGSLREYGGETYALYTLVDNEPELVFEGWSRNSYIYVNAYAGDSSYFYNRSSNSAAESGQGIFTLSRNGRELDWQRFYFTCAEDGDLDKVTVYVNTTGSWEPEESELSADMMDITLEEYYQLFSDPVVENVTDFWGKYCTESGLYLTPFSAWDSGSAADGPTTGVEGDDGRGDLFPDDGDGVPVLMGGALPFTNMETLQSEKYEDGTYYYADVTEDGLTIVVNTVLPRDFSDDAQTLEDYLTGCALDLWESDTWSLQSVEKNEAYTGNMSFPVYIVTYTAGENEDTREWTVFAMDTDCYTYLYGFGVSIDWADDEMKSVYQDIFAGLYLSDGE